jgi:hypothetical protein
MGEIRNVHAIEKTMRPLKPGSIKLSCRVYAPVRVPLFSYLHHVIPSKSRMAIAILEETANLLLGVLLKGPNSWS